MIDVERQTIDGSGEAPCRYLALRVIEQAFRDLTSSDGRRADHESARAFLAGSPVLYRWCEIANVSAATIIARATTLEYAFSQPGANDGSTSHRTNRPAFSPEATTANTR